MKAAALASTPLQLRPVNDDVVGVFTAQGQLVGNLKRIELAWKFKAIGIDANGNLEPGGGPLTGRHNLVFEAPDVELVNAALGARAC